GISLWWIQSNRKIESPEKRVAFQLFWLLLFFSVPYYLSGGDWFPPSLGRYLFPFSFFSFIFFISIALETSVELRKTSVFSLFLFGVLFLATLSFPFGSFTRLSEGLFTHKSSLSAINLKKLGKGNYRIQYLSQLGNHLKATTGPKTVIGSSEIATIMFFAEREALDLLGVTNIEIARSPLRKTPELFSKVKSQNELPHLIFKRLKPELLFEKRPGIFYAFDYILKDLLDNDHPEEISESDLSLALKRWERKFQELNQSLFGGMEALEKHGYDPVLVKHGNGFVSLYFVSRETKEEHFSMMRQAGMAQSVLRNSHL
ncbi:hypothetical protein EBT16_09570, partial [bacterium]|nr:hypothetical protein [bacterium]